MTLAAVKGQARAIDAIRSALRTDSVHHAWLFAGPEGVGKELTAIGFAQALTCPERPNEGCGECASCGRITRRNHPDVQWLMPEDEQVARGFAGRSDFTGVPSREIKVEQIRALQERLAFRALEGERKVAIIASAHLMNKQAQNALLKTLEEPPRGTVLVLIASSPDSLEATIRSRCTRAHFGPLPEAFIAERLEQERKLDPQSALLAAVLGAGSLSRAMQVDTKALAKRREIVESFEQLSFSDAGALLGFAESFGSSREDAETTLQILALWTRDVAVARVGGTALANRDLEAQVRTAAARVGDVQLQHRHRWIGETLTAIADRNGSPRLQMERMLIEISRVAAPSQGGTR